MAYTYLYGEAIREEREEPGEADGWEVDAEFCEVRSELRHALVHIVEKYERARARGQQCWREEPVWKDALDERREHPERLLLVCMHQQQRRRYQVHALAVPDRGIASATATTTTTVNNNTSRRREEREREKKRRTGYTR